MATNRRLAGSYYTDDGRTATKQIWDETLNELSGFHMKEILASME